MRLEVQGLDRVDLTRPHLFAANHQSIIDIPVLFRSLPVALRFVAKESLRRVPFLGRFIEAMGMVYVRLDNRVKGVNAVGAAQRLLAEGESVVTFPEGTRSADGSVARFKPGSLVPAIRSGTPVVPVAIHGAREVLPREGFRVRPGTIRVAIGEAIATRDLRVADRIDLAHLVRDRVVSMLAEEEAD